ncbi:MAG: hypothetical protein IT428_00440 [Planctomycetaceae bacterium]|nr:hypothetical protein [Planctomycetaceae bacterium]
MEGILRKGSANASAPHPHERQPAGALIDHWLDPDVSDPNEIRPLLAQNPSDAMPCWPVSKRVGNVRNDGPELAEPVPEGAP